MAVQTGIVVQSLREVLFPPGMDKEMERKEKLVWSAFSLLTHNLYYV